MTIDAAGQAAGLSALQTGGGEGKYAVPGFFDAVQRQYSRSVSAVSAAEQAEAPAREMTLEEYRESIYSRISDIPLHPSQALSSISFTISDAGFQAMKDDPAYEKWVLDRLKYDFGFDNPWIQVCGGGYSTHFFGATREEYRGEGWYPGFAGGTGGELYAEKSKDSFWQKRMKKHELYMEAAQKKWLKQQIILSQDLRCLSAGGKRAPYLAGVPASFLLSGLL